MTSKQLSNSPKYKLVSSGAGFSLSCPTSETGTAGKKAEILTPHRPRTAIPEAEGFAQEAENNPTQQSKHPLQRNQTSHSGDGRLLP